MSFKITARKGAKNRATTTRGSLNAAIAEAQRLVKQNGKNYYIYSRVGKGWKYQATVKAIKQKRKSGMGRYLKPVFDSVVLLATLSVGVKIIGKL